MIEQVRLLIPDTGSTTMFSDTEIQTLLDLNENSPVLAAAQALEILAGKFLLSGGAGVVRTDDLTVDNKNVIQGFLDRAALLRSQGGGDAFEIVYPDTEVLRWSTFQAV